MQTDKEIVAEYKKEILQEYNRSIGFLMDTYRAFDTAILSLTTGALGVCGYLIVNGKGIAEQHDVRVGMACLLGAEITILLSFLFGILAFKRQQRGLAANFGLRESDPKDDFHILQLITDGCNIVAGIAFVLGVVFILCSLNQIILKP